VHAGAVIVPGVLVPAKSIIPMAAWPLIGIAVGTEVLCRLSLVVPRRPSTSRFSPDAIFRRHWCRRGRRRRARPQRQADRRCARHRRQYGRRHHRISGRGRWTKRLHAAGRLNPAFVCGLLARQRICRPAHGVSRACMVVPRFRAHDQWRLRRATADFGTRWVTDTLASAVIPVGPWRSLISIEPDAWPRGA